MYVYKLSLAVLSVETDVQASILIWGVKAREGKWNTEGGRRLMQTNIDLKYIYISIHLNNFFKYSQTIHTYFTFVHYKMFLLG